jgi:hypothetical protein
MRGGLLQPSGGLTQARTTPRLAVQATLSGEYMELVVALWPAHKRVTSAESSEKTPLPR